MRNEFKECLEHSGYIHRPLKLNNNKSFEKLHHQNELIKQEILFSDHHEFKYQWSNRNQGSSYINNQQQLVLSAPTRMPSWPPGSPEDGDYCNFGQVTTYCSLPNIDWRDFNRISFEILPECDGAVNPHIMVGLKNNGTIKIPDIYNREGYHTVNLINYEWNQCFLEITDLPRDRITEISFTSLLNGQDRATSEKLKFTIKNITLEKVAKTSISKGWIPQVDDLIYSHNGYYTKASKIAIINNSNIKNFQLIDATSNKIVYEQAIKTNHNFDHELAILDFSDFTTKGTYYLAIAGVQSEAFIIGDYITRWHESIWTSLNFIFCERCGYPVPDMHSSCHEDILATHNNKSIIFNGGWHDAGDVSQQLVQTAEVTQSLFEIAEVVKNTDHQLYLRLLEEAEWGFDFILKTRFGDGYRATSAGITIWSNNLIGDMDDTICRVHNNAYENFFLSGITARIALSMSNMNRLKKKAIAMAMADYQFALEQFKINGFKHEPIFWEHTYSTSKSLYLATISWASSMLYQLTNKKVYRDNANQYVNELLKCQEVQGIKLDDGTVLKGFFYRDEKHQVIQHFNHQAREHLYAMALDAIIETQKDNSNYDLWLQRMKDYGDYLVYLTKYTYPYPMIPSGIYKEDENLDDESFYKQHLLVGPEAKDDYLKQLKLGHCLAPKLYLKKFPVWFSFKGNNAILLSMGKSASIIGKRFKNQKLIEIAEGQLQWMIGMNPFGQSLVYGQGHNFAQQYSVLSGEMVGEMPVGIQTFGNEDNPYWPQLNNATYKEVWVGVAGKWLSILVDLYNIKEEI